MNIDNTDDFFDLVLKIEHTRQNEAKEYEIRVSDSHNGLQVGFVVTLPSGMGCGLRLRGEKIVLDPDAIYRNGVKFRSIGSPSDNLLAWMAKGYGFEMPSLCMKKLAAFTCIVLEGDVQSLTDNPMKCKLFYDERMLRENSEEDYCEFYLNVSLQDQTVEILEKDQEYRLNVIRAFAENFASAVQ